MILLLSLIVFMPAVAAMLLVFIPKERGDVIRWLTLMTTIAVLVAVIFMATGFEKADDAAAWMQDTFSLGWIPSFNINYYMGLDGFSFPLVVLTAIVSVFAMGASWSITKHLKAYCILFLILESAMLGVFMALDFFLFYVFWEVMLLPMYFLIGVWGGPRRLYASVKFFLYTLAGGVLMLIAMLILYFNSDLRKVAEVSDFYPGNTHAAVHWDKLHISKQAERDLGRSEIEDVDGKQLPITLIRNPKADNSNVLTVELTPVGDSATAAYDANTATVSLGIAKDGTSIAELLAAINENAEVAAVLYATGVGENGEAKVSVADPIAWELPVVKDEMVHSFNLLALAAMGQHTDCYSKSLQITAFVLLFIGFIVKLPAVPVHTWLPDAHVEAPTPISMILAGVLLKMGGYGIIRICYPICPWGAYELAWLVCGIGVISMVYGAFAALAQKDFKRLVAYSSVSHMGYVLLGMGVWSATAGNPNGPYDASAWNMGVSGAMFQMIGHGVSSAGMFFMVGIVYDRVHHRNLDQFGGLFGKMPVYTALAIGIFFAGLGLPGLCGFIGEVFVVLSVWNYSPVLAIVAAFVVILTAGYILWALHRVYLGAEYKGPHEEELKPITPREFSIALPILLLAILLGVVPYQTVLTYMDETVTRQVNELAEWTENVVDAPAEAQAEAPADKDAHPEEEDVSLEFMVPEAAFAGLDSNAPVATRGSPVTSD